MRVVCIDDKDQHSDDMPKVKKGHVYNVVRTVYSPKRTNSNGYTHPAGDYYELIECGSDNGYHSDLFLQINEDQQDEVNMERSYKTETA